MCTFLQIENVPWQCFLGEIASGLPSVRHVTVDDHRCCRGIIWFPVPGTETVEANMCPFTNLGNRGRRPAALSGDVSMSPGGQTEARRSPLDVNTHRKPRLTMEPENRGQRNVAAVQKDLINILDTSEKIPVWLS